MNPRMLASIAALGLSLTVPAAFAKNDKAGKPHTADPHMSTQGMQNTNSPHAGDHDKGQARSAERMNESGMTHRHADEAKPEKSAKPKKAKKNKHD